LPASLGMGNPPAGIPLASIPGVEIRLNLAKREQLLPAALALGNALHGDGMVVAVNVERSVCRGYGIGSGCCASFGLVQTCRGTRFACGVGLNLWQMTPSVISQKVSNFAQIGRRDRAKMPHGRY
jgi:hypothetical protein